MFKLTETYMALMDVPNTSIKGGDLVKIESIQAMGVDSEYLISLENSEVPHQMFKFNDHQMYHYFFNSRDWKFKFKDVGTDKKRWLGQKQCERIIEFSCYGTKYIPDEFNQRYIYAFGMRLLTSSSEEGLLRKAKKQLDRFGFNIELEHWSYDHGIPYYSEKETAFLARYVVRYLVSIKNVNPDYLHIFNSSIVNVLKNLAVVRFSCTEKETLMAIQASEKVFQSICENVKTLEQQLPDGEKGHPLLNEFKKQIDRSYAFLNDLNGAEPLLCLEKTD